MKKSLVTVFILCMILIACGQKSKSIDSKIWVNDFEHVFTET